MDLPASIALRREPGHLVRSLTALTLRLGLGLIFLAAGYGKFQAKKAGDYPRTILEQFDPEKNEPGAKPKHFLIKLRPDMVKLFADVLPYAEVGLGAALIVGIWTTLAAFLSGVLLLNLLFGQLVQDNIAMFPAMLTYLLVNAGILWLSPVTSNYLSLDGLLFGWFWAPKSAGSYRHDRDPDATVKVKAAR